MLSMFSTSMTIHLSTINFTFTFKRSFQFDILKNSQVFLSFNLKFNLIEINIRSNDR